VRNILSIHAILQEGGYPVANFSEKQWIVHTRFVRPLTLKWTAFEIQLAG
jgi:hypothetical protein